MDPEEIANEEDEGVISTFTDLECLGWLEEVPEVGRPETEEYKRMRERFVKQNVQD